MPQAEMPTPRRASWESLRVVGQHRWRDGAPIIQGRPCFDVSVARWLPSQSLTTSKLRRAADDFCAVW